MVRTSDKKLAPPPAARLLTGVVNAGVLLLLVGLLAAAASSHLSSWLGSPDAAGQPLPGQPLPGARQLHIPTAITRELPVPPDFPGHSPQSINL